MKPIRNRLFVGAVLFFIIVTAFNFKTDVMTQYVPKDGFIPDKETAVKVAEAVWLPIYGSTIYNSRPFKATLSDSTVWIVEGTLKKNYKGGVPYLEIQKADGKILKVNHSK